MCVYLCVRPCARQCVQACVFITCLSITHYWQDTMGEHWVQFVSYWKRHSLPGSWCRRYVIPFSLCQSFYGECAIAACLAYCSSQGVAKRIFEMQGTYVYACLLQSRWYQKVYMFHGGSVNNGKNYKTFSYVLFNTMTLYCPIKTVIVVAMWCYLSLVLIFTWSGLCD